MATLHTYIEIDEDEVIKIVGNARVFFEEPQLIDITATQPDVQSTESRVNLFGQKATTETTALNDATNTMISGQASFPSNTMISSKPKFGTICSTPLNNSKQPSSLSERPSLHQNQQYSQY